MITIDYMVAGYYRISKDGARIADVENRNTAILIKNHIERLEARIAELESTQDEDPDELGVQIRYVIQAKYDGSDSFQDSGYEYRDLVTAQYAIRNYEEGRPSRVVKSITRYELLPD